MLNNKFGFDAFRFSGITMSGFAGVVIASSCGITASRFKSNTMSKTKCDSPISLSEDLSLEVFLP